jgi:hypothetical protein
MQVNKLIKALNTFADTTNNATKTLREAALAAGFHDWESAQPIVLQWASTRYGVGLVESQSPRNKGEMVLDRSAAKFEAAKTAVRYVREALTGDADASGKGARSTKTEPVEVPAHIAKLAAALAAACSEYEQAKRLAAQAIAEAFAAK